MPDFLSCFYRTELFDRIVFENGGLLYHPATASEKILTDPPPSRFIDELRRRGIAIYPGKTVVATWRKEADRILQTIRDMGLELQIVFNRDALMVLPSGVNKASGLKAALVDMKLSAH